MPAQSSPGNKFSPEQAVKHWQYLVGIAHDKIAGIAPAPESKIERSPPPRKGDPVKKWQKNLSQSPIDLEPMLDGSKTSLILADAIAEELKKIISAPSSEFSLEKDGTLYRKLTYLYKGLHEAATQIAALLMGHSEQSLDVWNHWLNVSMLDSDVLDILEKEHSIEEWIIDPSSKTNTIVKALYVARGLYTSPSRFPRHVDDQWKLEARYENPYVLLYDAPLTQIKILESILVHLRSVAADNKKPALIIIADGVSDEVLAELDSPSNQVFSYLVLPVPSYSDNRSEYLNAIAKFTGADLLPEESLPFYKLADENEEIECDDYLTMTIPFEAEDENEIQVNQLGTELKLVLSNRQRTLLIQRRGEADDEDTGPELDWPQYKDTLPEYPKGPEQAAVTVTTPGYAQQVRHCGLVVGGGAAFVWAKSHLNFTPLKKIDDEKQQFSLWKLLWEAISTLCRKLANNSYFQKIFNGFQEKFPTTMSNRDLYEKGWKALQSALEAPMQAIVSKAGITSDSEQYTDLVAQIQAADNPVVGYSLEAANDNEEIPTYRLKQGDLNDDSIIRHAAPPSATATLVRNAAPIARVVHYMKVSGGNDE